MNTPRRAVLAALFALLVAAVNAGAAEPALSYGLLVDNSNVVRDELNGMIDAGKALLAASKPGDEAFVLRFVGSDNLSVIQPMTRDKAALSSSLDDLYAEAGGPALIDALYLAVAQLDDNAEKKGDRRKGFVALTGGEDRGSYYTSDDLLKLIGARKLPVYFIVLAPPSKKPAAALDAVAAKTGGKVYHPKSKAERQAAVAGILEALRR